MGRGSTIGAWACGAAVAAGVLAWSMPAGSPAVADEKPRAAPVAAPVAVAAEAPDAAVERTRKQTRMLDTLYKTAVVAITETYVGARTTTPAATAAKVIFAAMEKNGFHQARLLDLTGEPTNKDNVARDDFEKKAVAELAAGRTPADVVETVEGKRYLRTATLVPVVMKQCLNCHANYKKVGDPAGALVYRLPVE